MTAGRPTAARVMATSAQAWLVDDPGPQSGLSMPFSPAPVTVLSVPSANTLAGGGATRLLNEPEKSRVLPYWKDTVVEPKLRKAEPP